MQCILCGCSQTKAAAVSVKKSKKTFFRCAKCDFCFLDRTQLLDFSQEKERYLLHRNSIDNAGYVNWLGGIVDCAVHEIDLEEKNVLDYGCGHTPVLPAILKSKVPHIGKVDYYDLYFFPNIDFSEKYACIFAVEVFEHFRDVYKEAVRVFSLIEPGGYIVISTGLLPEENKFASWWYIQDATHISFYSLQTFKWFARMFSLKIIFSDGKSAVILQKS